MFLFFIQLVVRPFYKAHLVFFAFLLMACFGVVTRTSLLPYHLFIMQSMLNKPVVLVCVLLLWLFYAYKCLLFCKKVLEAPDGGFWYELQCFSVKRQCIYFLITYVLLFAPFILYAGFFAAVALRTHYYTSAGVIVFFWLLMLLLSVRFSYSYLNSSWVAKHQLFKLFDSGKGRLKNLYFILLHYLNEERKIAFLLLKLFAAVILYSVLVWNEGGFGRDFFVMMFQLLLLAHTPLPYECFRFMEQQFLFHRNLPLRTGAIAGQYIFTYAVALLPELFFLLVKHPALFSMSDLFLLYGIAVSTLFFLTAILYSDAMKKEDYVKVVFMLLFISTFALNAGYFAAWLFIESGIGVLLFFRSYPHYTPATE